MSRPQRRLALALALALVAALMYLGVANADRHDADRDARQSLYLCNVWNDRSWAGCS
jgi:hypothetical protein